MTKPELTVQVRSGGFSGPQAFPFSVSNALDRVLDRLPIRRVIMGWATNKTVYEQAAEKLHARGIELLLWLPVFSEIGQLRPCLPVLDHTGQQAAAYEVDATERFDFYCPNQLFNIHACLDVYNQYFADLDFDGVFLDKIRYPSFINGFAGGLCCHCPTCQDTYAEAGLDMDALQACIADLGQHRETPFGVRSYSDAQYEFGDATWHQFFTLRSQIISDALTTICVKLRAKGLTIGLDVFAPFMSQFVGQDIAILSTLADFVKPMMYAATKAPAGLPFELDALMQATGLTDQPKAFCDIVGIDPAEEPFDMGFCARQITELQSACVCPIHPGIEVNRMPGIANTSPAYIERCLQTYEGADGLVLSWDLLEMPDAHLDAIAAAM